MNQFKKEDFNTLRRWFAVRVYLVEIKQKENLSESYLRTYGTLTTGDRKLDNEMYSAPVSVYKKIPELMELYELGVEIRFPDPKQCAEIYHLANEMISRMTDSISSGINLQMYDVEGIKRLDDFLKNIFPLAAPYIPKESWFDPFAGQRLIPVKPVGGEQKVREHDSYAALLEIAMFGSVSSVEKPKPVDEYAPFKY